MTAQPIRLQVARGAEPVPVVQVTDRLRWTLGIVAELVDLSENKIRELIRRGEFPPRIAVDGKDQFVPAEVRAWAAGGDWRGMVAARTTAVAS